MAISPAELRQLAPAGPVMPHHDTMPSPAAVQRPGTAVTDRPGAATVTSASDAAAQGPIPAAAPAAPAAQWPGAAADAAAAAAQATAPDSDALTPAAPSQPDDVSQAADTASDAVQSLHNSTCAVTDVPVPHLQQHPEPQPAMPAEQQPSSAAQPTTAPGVCLSEPALEIVAPHAVSALLQQQPTEPMLVQSDHEVAAASEPPVRAPNGDARHQAAVSAALHRRSVSHVGTKSSRRGGNDRHAARTRMSLRSQTQVPIQKRRKGGNGRADRRRSERPSGRASGYATRQAYQNTVKHTAKHLGAGGPLGIGQHGMHSIAQHDMLMQRQQTRQQSLWAVTREVTAHRLVWVSHNVSHSQRSCTYMPQVKTPLLDACCSLYAPVHGRTACLHTGIHSSLLLVLQVTRGSWGGGRGQHQAQQPHQEPACPHNHSSKQLRPGRCRGTG